MERRALSTRNSKKVTPLENKKINRKLDFTNISEDETQQPPATRKSKKRPPSASEIVPPHAEPEPDNQSNITTRKKRKAKDDSLILSYPAEELEDLSNYPKLHVKSEKNIRVEYSLVETNQKQLKPNQKVSYRHIDRDLNALKYSWRLGTVAVLSKFIYSSKPNADLSEILKSRARDILDYLKRRTRYSGNALSEYESAHIFVKQFHGFKPVTTDFDEPAYQILVAAKINGKPQFICRVILGSIGIHSAECVFELRSDTDFAFYPFIIADGDSVVFRKIYEYLHVVHGGSVRYVKFNAVDMWRVLTCLVFFCAKMKDDMHPRIVLRISRNGGESKREEHTMAVHSTKLTKLYLKITSSSEPVNLVTSELVHALRLIVYKSYEKKFNTDPASKRDWVSDATAIEWCCVGTGAKNVPACQVKKNGKLWFEDPQQLVAFLYFYGRYHTCTYVHRQHGVDFDLTLRNDDDPEATVAQQ